MTDANVLKGLPVWLDMDQATLDNAYDQRVWAPNFEQLAARRRFLNERARGRIERPAVSIRVEPC